MLLNFNYFIQPSFNEFTQNPARNNFVYVFKAIKVLFIK
jgi:hypothetical protein